MGLHSLGISRQNSYRYCLLEQLLKYVGIACYLEKREMEDRVRVPNKKATTTLLEEIKQNIEKKSTVSF